MQTCMCDTGKNSCMQELHITSKEISDESLSEIKYISSNIDPFLTQPKGYFRQEAKLIIVIYFFSVNLFIYKECTKSGSSERSRNQTARDTAPLPMGSRLFLPSTQPKRSFSNLCEKLHSQCLLSPCPQVLFSPLLCVFSCFSQRQVHSLLPSNVTTVCLSKKSSEVAFVLGSPMFSVGASIVSAIQFHRYFSYTHTYLLVVTIRLTRFHTIHKHTSLFLHEKRQFISITQHT